METISKVIQNEAGTIKIHGIQTGKLAIKKGALTSKNPGTLSTLWSFRGKAFGEWLPVWAWVIEHPKGNFLIDTGLSTDVLQPHYFKKLDFISKYYFEKQMKFEIEEKAEIHQQLKQIGIGVEAIDQIILTHLHIDHTGGLKHFSGVEVLVNEREWKTMDGSFPKLFPSNLNLKKVRLADEF
ncbi:MAG: MBL fold metallo-hydrolase, partial [Bacteroidota bacterium]